MTTSIEDFFGEAVFSYTRAQAIDDGVLIDVSETAQEAGFKFNTVVTRAVWNDCIDWDNDSEQAYQDISGRLWDVLFMAAFNARRSEGSTSFFELYCIPQGKTKAALIKLKMVIGPGDTPEPVITIMLPDED